ncbi:hypothetical protein FRC11_001524 [Ceratobasidium sp. 423]|nr:hypothetical protein FRC11_001524 [Ceratobasidium sp. 423]
MGYHMTYWTAGVQTFIVVSDRYEIAFIGNQFELNPYYSVESSIVALNPSNSSSATATIRTSLTPGLMYLRTEAEVRKFPSRDVCDFIDDYCSGSVLDVVGSVGGLFALLQAIHLLLFGRPLFWGLSGSKLITPFGLLGKCSSRDFKRHLKDEYHSKSTVDGSDTIRIAKFLHDFVIEFGPADLDPESHSSRQLVSSPSPSAAKDEDAIGTQVLLMVMGSNTISVRQKDDDSDDDVKRHDYHYHINSVDRV